MAKRTREHTQRCVQGITGASLSALTSVVVLPGVGIRFEKEKGQHILKNPLVITAMIEKVIVNV